MPKSMMSKCFLTALVFLYCCGAPATPAIAATFQTLFSFSSDGHPEVVALAPHGRLYGYTDGSNNPDSRVVFSFDLRTRSFHVISRGGVFIYSITATPEGRIFGTTQNGGDRSIGSVFEVLRSGDKDVLRTVFSFPGGVGGNYPTRLTAGPNGTLFGTTQGGGDPRYNNGVVFELQPRGSTYAERVLWMFGARGDGISPGAVALMPNGTIVGSTAVGGGYDEGNLYSLTPTGYGTQVTYYRQILYSFKVVNDAHGPLIYMHIDKAGDIYATAPGGICNDPGCSGELGCAVELFPDGKGQYADRILHSFKPRHDGYEPDSPLALGPSGSFVGTTHLGSPPYGGGIIYQLVPHGNSYEERITHAWHADGGGPIGWAAAPDKTLYGVTSYGGAHGYGTIFEYVP